MIICAVLLRIALNNREVVVGNNLLWPKSDKMLKNEDFSLYGCEKASFFRNNDNQAWYGGFGHEKIACSGKKYKIKASEYRHFATERVNDAIVASANLILYYHNLDKGGRDNCQQQQWVVSKKLLKCLKKNS